MSRRLVSAVLGAIGVLAFQVAVAPGSEAIGRDQLLGTWTSIDTDGSHQSLSIRGGGSGNYAVQLYDEAATSACGGVPARVSGSGRATGDQLTVTATMTCLPGGNVLRSRVVLEFWFDQQTGTLYDGGVVWYRS